MSQETFAVQAALLSSAGEHISRGTARIAHHSADGAGAWQGIFAPVLPGELRLALGEYQLRIDAADYPIVVSQIGGNGSTVNATHSLTFAGTGPAPAP